MFSLIEASKIDEKSYQGRYLFLDRVHSSIITAQMPGGIYSVVDSLGSHVSILAIEVDHVNTLCSHYTYALRQTQFESSPAAQRGE